MIETATQSSRSLQRMVRRHGPMVERSLTLQRMLRAAGYVKRDGVATAGISLVSRLAKKHKLRDWPHTRSVEDYDALIEVVGIHLAECVVPPNDPSSPTAADGAGGAERK